MGTIKNQKISNGKEFPLTEFEIGFIQALNQNGVDAYNRYRELVRTFLGNLAGSKWGFPPDAVLDFEIEPTKKVVKVTEAKIDK